MSDLAHVLRETPRPLEGLVGEALALARPVALPTGWSSK